MASEICFSGYYGFGNTGDEAILYAALAGLREQDQEVVLHVLVASPDPLRHMLKDAQNPLASPIKTSYRMSPRGLIRALWRSQVLVSGGGGLFQDSSSWRSPLYYFLVIALAKMFGCQVVILSQGVGPLKRWWNRMLTAWAMKLADVVSLRDQRSIDMLRDYGVKKKPIRLLPDPGITLRPCSPKKLLEVLKEEGLSELLGGFEGPMGPIANRGPLVLVCPRDYRNIDREALLEALQDFAQEHHARYLLLPLERERDLAICRQLHEGLQDCSWLVQGSYTPQVLTGMLHCADLVLAIRLHGAILATAGAVPSVAVAYDPKVQAFCQRYGVPWISPERIAETLGKNLEQTLAARKKIREDLQGLAEESKKELSEIFKEIVARAKR